MEPTPFKIAAKVRPKDIAGALGWTALLCLAPADLLIVGSVVFIPLYIACEVKRAKAVAFWPGFACRAVIVVGTFATASWFNPKFEERLVSPPAQTELTLAAYRDLLREQRIPFLIPETHHKVRLRVPPGPQRVADVIRLVEQQAGLEGRIRRCMSGRPLPTGPHCAVRFRPADSAPNRPLP
jgi:hypothetical protein